MLRRAVKWLAKKCKHMDEFRWRSSNYTEHPADILIEMWLEAQPERIQRKLRAEMERRSDVDGESNQ